MRQEGVYQENYSGIGASLYRNLTQIERVISNQEGASETMNEAMITS